MSRELTEFRQRYADFARYYLELAEKLSKSHPKFFSLIGNRYDFSPNNFLRAPWVTLDNKTLAEFRALIISKKVWEKVVSLFYADVNCSPEQLESTITQEQLLNPRKLNPQQLIEVSNSVIELTDDSLRETINNRTGAEIILNFLKSCANFLITILTCGQKQNFFKTSTFELEKTKQVQRDLRTIFDKLNEEEKTTELKLLSTDMMRQDIASTGLFAQTV